jgi:hypothetical protein
MAQLATIGACFIFEHHSLDPYGWHEMVWHKLIWCCDSKQH